MAWDVSLVFGEVLDHDLDLDRESDGGVGRRSPGDPLAVTLWAYGGEALSICLNAAARREGIPRSKRRCGNAGAR